MIPSWPWALSQAGKDLVAALCRDDNIMSLRPHSHGTAIGRAQISHVNTPHGAAIGSRMLDRRSGPKGIIFKSNLICPGQGQHS
ncbi:MAG: hypothetical protein ACYDHG_15415 [Desulfomonilaceae bacterium]